MNNRKFLFWLCVGVAWISIFTSRGDAGAFIAAAAVIAALEK